MFGKIKLFRKGFSAFLPFALFASAVQAGERAEVSVVSGVKGYNAWPMVVSSGKKTVCLYCRGTKHDPGERAMNVYCRTSEDQGLTWGEEVTVSAQAAYGESSVAKGIDGNGAMLLLTRSFMSQPPGRQFELFRTTDGKKVEKIAILRLRIPPMQITDIHPVSGLGLAAMWFETGYKPGRRDGSWGLVISKDNGKTWTQTVIEEKLLPTEVPQEESFVDLGNGKFLMLSRMNLHGTSLQFTSSDYGKTWKRAKTNIRDIGSNTPTLHFDRKSGIISCCYYQRGPGRLFRRTAKADRIFDHPEEWRDPELLATGSKRPTDSGNANMTRCGGKEIIVFYSGERPDTKIIAAIVDAPQK